MDDQQDNDQPAPAANMLYCRSCGKQIHETAKTCPSCGAPQASALKEAGELRTQTVAGYWCLFLGQFGAHWFYLRRTTRGIFSLLFCWTGIPGIFALVNGFQIAYGNQEKWAKRYNNGVETPPAHWSLKLLVVVLLLCSLIFIAAVVCSPPKNNSLASGNRSTFADIILTKEIELLNKGLPKMVDEETRWDNVKIQDGDIYYNYTLINYLASDLDIATFTGIMEPQIKNEDCNDKEVRPLIDAGRKLIFSYVDKTNKEIAQIIIDKSKCLPEASN